MHLFEGVPGLFSAWITEEYLNVGLDWEDNWRVDWISRWFHFLLLHQEEEMPPFTSSLLLGRDGGKTIPFRELPF